jgi:hypothetical protein
MPSIDGERYHLPPIQGYKATYPLSMKACIRAIHNPRHGWRVPKSVTVEKNVPPGTKALKYCGMISGCPNAEGGMRFAIPPKAPKNWVE